VTIEGKFSNWKEFKNIEVASLFRLTEWNYKSKTKPKLKLFFIEKKYV
jgi:hypothetical protein